MQKARVKMRARRCQDVKGVRPWGLTPYQMRHCSRVILIHAEYASGLVGDEARGYGASCSSATRKPYAVPLFGSNVVCSLSSKAAERHSQFCSTTKFATASPSQMQTASIGQRLSESTA